MFFLHVFVHQFLLAGGIVKNVLDADSEKWPEILGQIYKKAMFTLLSI
jgi:hypothetical protein